MYIVGLMGATRRLDTYDAASGWQPFYVLMLIGGIVIAIGVALQLAQIIASVIQKRRLHDATGDPWGGRTLEWSVPSPAPSYNFAAIPQVTTRDAYWEMKEQGVPARTYEDIRMPKNTASGIYISIFAFLVGFALVWHINWLAIVSLIGAIVCVIVRTFNDDTEYTITASEVKKMEETRLAKAQALRAGKDDGPDEDMGLIEFIKIVLTWAWSVVRTRKWRNQ